MLAIAPGWDMSVERGPDWLIVRVLRTPQAHGTPPLADEVWEQLCRHFTHRLVLELNEIERLDSALAEELMQLHRRIREQDGVMRVCGLSAENRRALCSCNLEEHLLDYHDREEAVMGARLPRRPR